MNISKHQLVSLLDILPRLKLRDSGFDKQHQPRLELLVLGTREDAPSHKQKTKKHDRNRHFTALKSVTLNISYFTWKNT